MSVIDRLTDLRSEIRGAVTTPDDAAWDDARRAWNLTVDQRPALVVEAADADDLAATVRFAREAGLRVAVQGTGHGSPARRDLEGAVLLRTSSMREVAIDPVRRTARAQAGAQWQDVAAAAAPHGLVGLHGSSPDVGVVGYTLGGGMGWLARRHGLACHHVTAFDVILPDGRREEITAASCPQLFWALRGGGGSYAIVAAIEFRLFALTEVVAGSLLWPAERAGEVLRRYHEIASALPEDLTSSGRLVRAGGNGIAQQMVVVEVASLRDEAATRELLHGLLELDPIADTIQCGGPELLHDLHQDPREPVPGVGDGLVLAELPDAAIDTLVRLCGPASGSPLICADLRQLGGALARRPEDCGALRGIPGAYVMFLVGAAPDAEREAALRRHVAEVIDAMSPWATGLVYLNFRETPVDAIHAFGTTTTRRLRDIATAIDPDRLLIANHEIQAY